MDVRKLTEQLSVAAQISPADVPALTTLGFRTLIGNRPDGEVAGQPPFAEIERAAVEAGMNVRFLPVVAGRFTVAQVRGFADMLREAPGPVLAYCRTGTRSTMLWALSQVGHLPASEILARAHAAGYDLSKMAPALSGPPVA
ncbi:MAG: TIGR01244 family phosphatase [Burkholderiaceae bacterium]|nr:TIGR01244 family phosphatase [Burkholderiaceae bacterium]